MPTKICERIHVSHFCFKGPFFAKFENYRHITVSVKSGCSSHRNWYHNCHNCTVQNILTGNVTLFQDLLFRCVNFTESMFLHYKSLRNDKL